MESTFNIQMKDNALTRWDSLANTHFAENLQLCDGVKDLLDSVSIKHAVASTSAYWKLKLKHKVTGLNHYFSDNQLFSGEDVEKHKPAPDVYLAAAAGIEVDPKNCIAVEDSVSGVMAAKAAGMYTVGCLGASHIFDKEFQHNALLEAGADEVINNMLELKPIIERLS